MRGALLCSAFATTALIPVQSFAQDQDNACAERQRAAEQIDFEQSGLSGDQYSCIVETNDTAQCSVLLTEVNAALGLEGAVSETEQARIRLSDEVVIARRAAAEGKTATAEPQVSMTRAEARIVYPDTDQQPPNVTIARAQPNIHFEQRDPQIEITSTGEPQVNWTQSGDPIVVTDSRRQPATGRPWRAVRMSGATAMR